MEQFWAWDKLDAIGGAGDLFTIPYRCNYFEMELWFELGKIIWSKHWGTFQDHVKYIHNDIVKPFRFVIFHYSDFFHEMHNLPKYLPPPSMKVSEYDKSD